MTSSTLPTGRTGALDATRTLRLSAAGVRRGDVRAALGMRRDFEKNAIAAAVSAAAVVESEGLVRFAFSEPGSVVSGE